MPLQDGSAKKKRSSLSHDERQRLIEKYNIRYRSDLKDDKWPKHHQHVFGEIKKLGNYEFEKWRRDMYVDSSRPWRQETKQRAETIVEFAQLCRKDRVNEEQWRRRLEHYIFLRFQLEVDCRSCTGKLWRSEIEAVAYSQDQFANKLSDRQNKREACKCPRRGPNSSPQGANKLFASQYGSDIVYEEELSVELGKKSEQPDAVYGLRRTGMIRSLLWTKDKRPESGGETIETTITSTPFHRDVRTTFPFLVSESKSEKAGVPQSEVESQMAFAVRSLLLVQENLRKAAGKDSRWMSGPLVWCVSHRGEEWQISAAFIKYRGNIEQFHIVDLWNGKVTAYDGAIRLVLILDYIFDWARDVYREAIIAELETLAVSTTRTHTIDADASSSIDTDTVISYREGDRHHLKSGEGNSDPAAKLNRIASWNRTNIAQNSEFDGLHQGQDMQDPLRRFDSDHGVLRDAKFIRSRVMGLYITQDNLDILFNSKLTDKGSKNLFKKIIVRLEKERPIFVNQEALTALELAWTGVDRGSLEFLNQDNEFQVLLTFSAYLTPDWEQTRELCYIAISRRAKKVMHQIVRGRNEDPKGYLHPSHRQSTCVHDTEIIMKIVYFHLQATIQTNLTACLYRSSVCPKLTGKGSDDHDVEDDIFRDDQGKFLCQMILQSKEKSRTVVWSIYKTHRVGRNEPSSPFLRVSSRWDEQKLDHQQNKRLPTPWTTYAMSNSETAVLACSEDPKAESTTLTRCIFLTDRSKLEHQLADLRSRKKMFPYYFLTDRLSVESGWDVYAWNKTYDWRKVNTWEPIRAFLKHIESVVQKEEEAELADVEEEEDFSDAEGEEDEDDSSSEETEEDE